MEMWRRHPSGMSVGQLVFRRGAEVGGEKEEVFYLFTESGKGRSSLRAAVLKFDLACFRIIWRACQTYT